MPNILTTMGVIYHSAHQTYMDAIDRQWYRLFDEASLTMMLVPNDLERVKYLINNLDFDGVLLTGGNSLSKYQGDAPQRDAVEYHLLEHCIDHQIPLVGVCRGMQLIQDYFGITLSPVPDHINKKHRLVVNDTGIAQTALLASLTEVNAYHAWGSFEESKPFRTLATSEDGVVMAGAHEQLPILGHMWHPERSQPFVEAEIHILKQVFEGQGASSSTTAVST